MHFFARKMSKKNGNFVFVPEIFQMNDNSDLYLNLKGKYNEVLFCL